MFSVSALLMDDALKSATPLTNGAINETLGRHVHRAWYVAPKQPGLKFSQLCCLDALQQMMVYQRWRFTTFNQLKQAIVTDWGNCLLRHLIFHKVV